MTGDPTLHVAGAPTGARAWRQQVAEAAARSTGGKRLDADAIATARGLVLDFTVRPGRFVDLDTLVETALAGLRDGGAVRRGAPELDVVLGTKSPGATTGLRVGAVTAAALRDRPPPGPALVDVEAARLPGAGREGKRAWRQVLADAWGHRPPVDGEVWVEATLAVPGSIVAPVEPILDALEPVLGRDPRGRDWQEFFPADDRITWLRLRRDRSSSAPRLRLALGPATRPG